MKRLFLTLFLNFCVVVSYGQIHVWGGSEIPTADSTAVFNNTGDIVGWRLKEITTVDDIAELENYEGTATTLIVKDSIRGGVFNKVATGNVDDTFIYNSSSTGFWQRNVSNSETVNVMWNPKIDNTDENSDLDALLEVYNSAKQRGFTRVYHPKGFYYCDSTLVAPTNLHYYGAGKGKTIISFDGNGENRGIYVKGNYTEIGETSTTAKAGDDSIVLSSNVNLIPNDVLVVADTIRGSYGISYYTEGEFLLVKDSINSSTIKFQQNILADNYPIGSKVYKIDRNWAGFSDMTVIGSNHYNSEIPNGNSAIELELLQDVALKNINVSNAKAITVWFRNVFGGIIENSDINQTYLDENGTGTTLVQTRYGINFNGCQNLEVKSNNIYANRHATDVGDNDAGYFVFETSVPVISRNIIFQNNNISSFVSRAANMHVGEYVLFKDNIISGGLALNGNHIKAINNTVSVTNTENLTKTLSVGFSKGSDFEIKNNFITSNNLVNPTAVDFVFNDLSTSHNHYPFIFEENTVVSGNTQDSRIFRAFSQDGVSFPLYINNNRFINKSSFSNEIIIAGRDFGKLNDLFVKNNVFDNAYLSTNNVNDSYINNNIFQNVQKTAVKLSNYRDAKILNNTIESNVVVGSDDIENSSIYAINGNSLTENGNTFEAPNNTYLLNINNLTDLVRGSYYQSSGSGNNLLTSVTNQKSFEYNLADITISDVTGLQTELNNTVKKTGEISQTIEGDLISTEKINAKQFNITMAGEAFNLYYGSIWDGGSTQINFGQKSSSQIYGAFKKIGSSAGQIVTNPYSTFSYPTFSFLNDSNTGMTSLSADNLSLVTGGSEKLKVTNNAITAKVDLEVQGKVIAQDATADDELVPLGQEKTQNLQYYTVSTLPTSPNTGDQALVTDADTPSWNTSVTGGGSTTVTVYYDGTNWIAH